MRPRIRKRLNATVKPMLLKIRGHSRVMRGVNTQATHPMVVSPKKHYSGMALEHLGKKDIARAERIKTAYELAKAKRRRSRGARNMVEILALRKQEKEILEALAFHRKTAKYTKGYIDEPGLK